MKLQNRLATFFFLSIAFLTCHNPALASMPNGSYLETCINCRISDDLLTCWCRHDGEMPKMARLQYASQCLFVENQQGQLACKRGYLNPLPPGSYQTACKDCSFDGTRLGCSCQTKNGYFWHQTELINADACKNDIDYSADGLRCSNNPLPARFASIQKLTRTVIKEPTPQKIVSAQEKPQVVATAKPSPFSWLPFFNQSTTKPADKTVDRQPTVKTTIAATTKAVPQETPLITSEKPQPILVAQTKISAATKPQSAVKPQAATITDTIATVKPQVTAIIETKALLKPQATAKNETKAMINPQAAVKTETKAPVKPQITAHKEVVAEKTTVAVTPQAISEEWQSLTAFQSPPEKVVAPVMTKIAKKVETQQSSKAKPAALASKPKIAVAPQTKKVAKTNPLKPTIQATKTSGDLPKGIYQQSCINCLYKQNRLACLCKINSKDLKITKLYNPERCVNITNTNGSLHCSA